MVKGWARGGQGVGKGHRGPGRNGQGQSVRRWVDILRTASFSIG